MRFSDSDCVDVFHSKTLEGWFPLKYLTGYLISEVSESWSVDAFRGEEYSYRFGGLLP